MTTVTRGDRSAGGDIPWWSWIRLSDNRHFLGLWFMLPALACLILLLTYPLGLGIWLSFTDTRIGREGIFSGLENFQWLADDSPDCSWATSNRSPTSWRSAR